MIRNFMCTLFNIRKETFSLFYSSLFLLLGLFILTAYKTSAQIIDSLGKENSSALTKTVAGPDTVAEGTNHSVAPKIIGKKTFEVDLKNGILTFSHVKKGSETVTIDMDLRKLNSNINPNAEIKQRIYTKSDDGVFLIFESGILAAFPEPNNIDGKGTIAYTSASDGSKIFGHRGATFLSEDGSILATTPTTLLILNPNNKDVIEVSYKTLFGDVSPLVMPVFSQGKDKNHVDLRDEVIKDGDKQVKITITLDNFRAEVLPDAL